MGNLTTIPPHGALPAHVIVNDKCVREYEYGRRATLRVPQRRHTKYISPKVTFHRYCPPCMSLF